MGCLVLSVLVGMVGVLVGFHLGATAQVIQVLDRQTESLVRLAPPEDRSETRTVEPIPFPRARAVWTITGAKKDREGTPRAP